MAKVLKEPLKMSFEEIKKEMGDLRKKYPKDFLNLQSDCYRILSNNLIKNSVQIMAETRKRDKPHTIRMKELLPVYVAHVLKDLS